MWLVFYCIMFYWCRLTVRRRSRKGNNFNFRHLRVSSIMFSKVFLSWCDFKCSPLSLSLYACVDATLCVESRPLGEIWIVLLWVTSPTQRLHKIQLPEWCMGISVLAYWDATPIAVCHGYQGLCFCVHSCVHVYVCVRVCVCERVRVSPVTRAAAWFSRGSWF